MQKVSSVSCKPAVWLAMFGTMGMLRVFAADYTWTGAANALWNATDANWTGAGAVWVNGAANNALFGAAGPKAVEAAPVTLDNLSFAADGYTVSGGPLLMHGDANVGAGMNAVLSATVTNVGIWEKTGTGTLALDPGATASNVFSSLKAVGGTLRHASGTTLVTLVGGNPESGPAFWVSGGTFVMDGGTLKTTGDRWARVSEGGTLLVTNGYVDLRNNSELLNAFNSVGTTTVGGDGVLEVNAIRISQNSISAENSLVNINTGGVLRISQFTLDASSPRKGTVFFNGGTVLARADTSAFFGDGNLNWLPGIYAKILAGGAVFDTNGKTITFKHPLLSGAANDGGVIKRGSGTLALHGTNLFTGGTTVWAGGLSLSNDLNLGAVPAAAVTNLTFAASGTLIAGATHALHANRTIAISDFVNVTLAPQAHTQTIHGVVAGAVGSHLRKDSTGTVIFDPGAGRTNSVGSIKTTAGTLTVASGIFTVITNAPGNLIYDTLHINGGTLLVAGGLFKTLGGTYAMTQNGALTVTNGTADLNSVAELLNAYAGSGNTTVSGSGVLDLQSLRISQNSSGMDNNVVNVNTGGTLRLHRFYIDEKTTSKGVVNFNGGKVVAKSSRSDFMGTTHTNWLNGIRFMVREGGAVIDSQAFAVDSKQPIYSGAEVDGGLRKLGAGSFTLATTNTYNGVTTVEAGTLVFGVDHALPPANTVMAASNGMFNVNGKTQTLAGLGGGGTVTNLAALTVTDTLAPGDAGGCGTLTLAGNAASFAGCTLSVAVSDTGAGDRLHVQGDLDLTELTLDVENPEQLSRFKKYTVASCTGTLTAPFGAVGTLPARWIVNYDAEEKTAYLVYNFGTLFSLR